MAGESKNVVFIGEKKKEQSQVIIPVVALIDIKERNFLYQLWNQYKSVNFLYYL